MRLNSHNPAPNEYVCADWGLENKNAQVRNAQVTAKTAPNHSDVYIKWWTIDRQANDRLSPVQFMLGHAARLPVTVLSAQIFAFDVHVFDITRHEHDWRYFCERS